MRIKHRLTFLSVCMGLAIFLFCALNIDAKIVFHAKIKHAGDTLYHIYAMEDNGSNLRRITNPNRYDLVPRWFPDGKQKESNARNIYRYDLNSRKMTQLTDFPLGHALFPHWVEGSLSVSPQGKMTTSWGHLKQKR